MFNILIIKATNLEQVQEALASRRITVTGVTLGSRFSYQAITPYSQLDKVLDWAAEPRRYDSRAGFAPGTLLTYRVVDPTQQEASCNA